jgi:hypothetical protein
VKEGPGLHEGPAGLPLANDEPWTEQTLHQAGTRRPRPRRVDRGRRSRQSRAGRRQRRVCPSIGQHFDASQTALNLVAVGYSLGLAASVLYFGAVGDRYGRKLLLIVGMVVTIPADCLAAWAPSIGVLFGARVLGGLAAGMAYPTTLALITALWSGPARTKSIALWAATGGAISALGPLCSGILVGALLVGIGLPADGTARCDRAHVGGRARTQPRERGDGTRRPPGRCPSRSPWSAASSWASTSRRCPTRGRSS